MFLNKMSFVPERVILRELKNKLTYYNGKYPQNINGNYIEIDYSGYSLYMLYLSVLRIFKPREIFSYDYDDEMICALDKYEWNYNIPEAMRPNPSENTVDMVLMTKLDRNRILSGWKGLKTGGYMISFDYSSNPDNMLNLISKQNGAIYYGIIRYKYEDSIYPIWIFRKITSIKRDMYDPELIIRPVKYKQKTFNVIREDMLAGGTKERVTYHYIQNIENKNIFYRGAVNGYAQVALALACLILGKKCHIIVNKNSFRYKHNITLLAMIFGAIIHPIEKPKNEQDELTYVSKLVEQYDGFFIPLGMAEEKFDDIYIQSNMSNISKYNPTNIWMISSTGTILKVLHKILPNTYFHVIFSSNIKEDIKNMDRVSVYKSPEKFWRDDTPYPPPYPTEPSYDGKVWQFVANYGKEGDYVLNVAGI